MTEEAIIALCITLFALSQISERIGNFMKLYLPPNWVGNLRDKEEDCDKEKDRERKIMVVSWIAGLITTALFWGANYLNGSSLFLGLGGQGSNFLLFLTLSIFLSFGSKFWHDILDIMMLYKDSKRVLSDPNTKMIDRVEELEARLRQRPSDIIREAWEKNHIWIEQSDGVVSVVRAYTENGEPCLRVYFKDEISAAKFRTVLIWSDSQGYEHRIRIEKKVSGEAKAHFGKAGGIIYNAANEGNRGTLGYFFEHLVKPEKYILSCYHVMKSRHTWAVFDPIGEEEIRFRSEGVPDETIAMLSFGYRNNRLDVAIANINNEVIDQAGLLDIKGSAPVTKMDEGTRVKIKGAQSNTIDAIIYESEVDFVEVNYDDFNDDKQDYHGLFSLCLPGLPYLKCPTSAGDSGAIVYRKNGEALGIIIGGSDSLSYAMRITTIEDNLGIRIIKNEDS